MGEERQHSRQHQATVSPGDILGGVPGPRQGSVLTCTLCAMGDFIPVSSRYKSNQAQAGKLLCFLSSFFPSKQRLLHPRESYRAVPQAKLPPQLCDSKTKPPITP